MTEKDELDDVIVEAIEDTSSDEFPWAESNEEKRRSFVFSTLGGDASVDTMEKLVQWLKNGRPPLRIHDA